MNPNTLRRATAAALAVVAMGAASGVAYARMGAMNGMAHEQTKTVGGAPMYPSKNIIQNAVNSKDHTTLVAAVKAAGLVDTLQSPGPFTVFAPTNAAFAKLPAGAVNSLLKPENKSQLVAVLGYHVVPGKLTAGELMDKVKAGGGRATLTTVQGEPLTVTVSGARLILTDAKGRASHVTIGDVLQSNGVIHVVDTVLLPG